ncbi:MAG: polynucleotide adenylyltransferase [Novosphingobium sp. 17-62-19]|uniref:CCA tRNA nucleotidyltransferase n=1 Tax=Novosphingobium sp. 17-62-19 TaxID=1970406 RepID=UPI000BD06441|nr:CCA tRNA nucleotidyltransferase [Novosphingobium sp. 17-62-19]OYX92447.1 MAG: polynucleotide adenylyltransferase [Novosphingobium sp. 35-62-5]OZA18605.1 MAG: polynucleotide adenylyltransferase [Novosphingobium sp. 17-62-19]HQS97865.1 CCA tRNA nucleotidyltransferase [Novosphingobium sp.]
MTERLPAAEWTARADLAALVRALDPEAEGNCRWVGGVVRDTLLGLSPKDVDMATTLLPEETAARLKAAGIKAVPTGIAHGTVTAVVSGSPVEITTLRRDVSTDGRHATVAFSSEWQDDAARRDFTINALYADPRTLELFDYHGGRGDLAARRVRFIGEARERIREDYLRILRYFRFQARFGSLPADAEAEAAVSELAAGMKGLSRERVGWELMTLLALPNPAPTVRRMAELGVLAQVLPEAQVAGLEALTTHESALGIAPDALRRLAALLPADPPLTDQVAARLRLSVAQRKRLACAAARDGGVLDARAMAYRLGMTEAQDRLLLAGEAVAPLNGWDVPIFPLKGGAIVARGVTAGPEVARLLKAVESRWVAEGFPDQTRVSALLDEALAEG